MSSILIHLGMAVLAGSAPNDGCAAPAAIHGEGVFAFDSSAATSEGPVHDLCARPEANSGGADIAHDLWYCWTSPCDGDVTIDTCGQTTVDTRLAVYEGCECPTTKTTPLACNDEPPDGPANDCGFQSRVSFPATKGASYLIRLGSEPSVGGGLGAFTVRCGPAPQPPCTLADDHCRSPGLWSAFVSDGQTRVAAADFRPAEDGEITAICWWGAYAVGEQECAPPADNFEVTYYADAAGIPGEVLAGPFRQSDGSLTVSGPIATSERLMDVYREYEYHGGHAPVPVDADGCYWVQIVNPTDGSCRWHWEGASSSSFAAVDGRLGNAPDGFTVDELQADGLSFCLNLRLESHRSCGTPQPVNDRCDDFIPIEEGVTYFNTANATSNEFSQTYSSCRFGVCCPLFGSAVVYRDIWYSFTPPCDGLLNVDMCDSLFDARVGVYESPNCPFYDSWIGCSDDACGEEQAFQPNLVVPVRGGPTYILQVGGSAEIDPSFTATSDCFTAHPPEAGGGCGDPVCESTVCDDHYTHYPECCSQRWDDWCALVALEVCSGQGGPGSIYLNLAANPPANETLRTFADFLSCHTAPCGQSLCTPPAYQEPCCLRHDYDDDGDSDSDDYRFFLEALTGP